MRPWLIQLGPFVIPHDAREEMCNTSFLMGTGAFVRWIWQQRRKDMPRVRRIKRDWPESCRTPNGFVLKNYPAQPGSNVMPMRQRKARNPAS